MVAELGYIPRNIRLHRIFYQTPSAGRGVRFLRRRSDSGGRSSSASEKKKSSATTANDGDVIVRCNLVTPFYDGNEASAEGTLRIAVHRGLAPLASNAFLDMVTRRHFDYNYLFRVVEGFIVQWGIESPKPGEEGVRKARFSKADVDPPPSVGNSSRRSNVRGALNFAGGNSAMGQVYVNRSHNPHLDNEPGSLPFASLDERSMEIIDLIHSYKEGMGQVKAVKQGDEEMKRLFPRISQIEKCWVAEGG